MNASACPTDADLLAWLREALESDPSCWIAAHVETCEHCQVALEMLSEEDPASKDLLRDLRRSLPMEELESEPEWEEAHTFLRATFERGHPPKTDASIPESLTHLGRHEILGILGQGGMGVVYKARNRKLDRLMAIKVMPACKLKDAAAIARFAREMKAIAHLSHPNIVAAYDADEADGKHFLTMEYIDGVDLGSLVKAQGPLPPAKAVDCVLQAARGLHHAHEKGIIHRDVKPANLMLDREGTVKVLDLGLARFESISEAQVNLTESGVVLGTVDFLAPEQAENSGPIDRQADIYSLGCTLYYLLTGKPLHAGISVVQKIMAHRDKPIPSLREILPTNMASLEPVFRKMVAARPKERYQTLAEVILALEPLARSADVTGADMLCGKADRPEIAAQKKRRMARGLAAAVMLATIAGVVLWRIDFSDPIGDKDRAIEGNAARDEIGRPYAAHALKRGTVAGEQWSGNGVGMRFRWCPPGRFKMGSPDEEVGRAPYESPQVEVTLSRGFWLAECEVTQEEWEKVIGTRPSRFHGEQGLPVENVKWQEAERFCKLLTKRDRETGALPPGWEYRLPTEAQWEYACRAGTTAAFHFGDRPEDLGDYAWFAFNSQIRSREVGKKTPNPWGFRDMHGNLWEWCRDWFQVVLPGGRDPEVTIPGKARVIRGGGWNATSSLCRSGFRSGQLPDEGGHLLGFRVAAVPIPEPMAGIEE